METGGSEYGSDNIFGVISLFPTEDGRIERIYQITWNRIFMLVYDY